MITTHFPKKPVQVLKQIGWWIFFLTCVFYAIFALYMGGVELLSQLGIVENAKYRATPLIFIVHAFSGATALITGPLQFNRTLLSKHRRLHKLSGTTYVFAIWTASMAALWDVLFFDIPFLGKVAFVVLSVLWFGTTTIAFLRIRRRDIKDHRAWMIRSFSLSFFFVTGGFWFPAMANTNLPHEISYPLSVFLAWALNLFVAEMWIRLTRKRFTKKELQHLTEQMNSPLTQS